MPGEWWEIEIAPMKQRDGLPTWHIQMIAGAYREQTRGFATSLHKLSDRDGASPLKSVGAAAVLDPTVSRLVRTFSLIDINTVDDPISLLESTAQASKVIVYDVGQASMNALVNENGLPMLLIDVGLPVSYNRGTLSRKFEEPVLSENPIVLLTHWDWDHMCAGLEIKKLQNLMWVVPDQRVIGPGKTRFAASMAKNNRLAVWNETMKEFNFGTVMYCSGSSGDVNNTGLAVLAKLSHGNVLVPGDADYGCIPLPPDTHLDSLVGTHHGGNFSGICLCPASKQSAVVFSYGVGNVYRHPKNQSLTLHRGAGWKINQTAGVGGALRGKRIIP